MSQTKVMTVGRQSGVFLLLDHGSISRRHAELRYAGGQYTLHDMGSKNGTYVNDTRLAENSTTILQQNDCVSFGKDIAFTFQLRTVGKAGQGSTREKEKATALPPHSDGMTIHSMKTGFFDPAILATIKAASMAKAAQPVLLADGSLQLPEASSPVSAGVVATLEKSVGLILVTPDGKTQVFLLRPGKRITLGRDRKNAIVLTDAAASRFHAEVYQGPDGYYIADTGSSNGVSINHTSISNPYHLAHGDTISIGSIHIYFLAAAETGTGSSLASETKTGNTHTKICGVCALSNSPVARFCAQCGTPL